MAGLESKKAALCAKAAEKRRKNEEALQAKTKQAQDLEVRRSNCTIGGCRAGG